MGWTGLKSLALDDEEIYDRMKGAPDGFEPPEYPPHLMFSLPVSDLEKAKLVDGSIGDESRFSAMGEVTSIYRAADNSRIEIQLTRFAGDDGKLFNLTRPAAICLCSGELEKMGLDDDCERGDEIHLIGTMRLESESDTEFSGKVATVQIMELSAEDESGEGRGD